MANIINEADLYIKNILVEISISKQKMHIKTKNVYENKKCISKQKMYMKTKKLFEDNI